MSIDKKDKNDESSFGISSGHINRDERYRSNSPGPGPVKNEFNGTREKSPERETKDSLINREGSSIHFLHNKDHQFTPHNSDRHFGPPGHSSYNLPPIGSNADHTNNPYRLPPNQPPIHGRQYPQKEYYPRRYNDFQKDFIVNKKKEDLNLSDAMQFLETVKGVFSNDLSVYDSFLEVMRDYKHGKLDAAGVVRAATSLFKTKPELLDGFNDFLPGEYKVDRNYRRRVRIDPPIRTHDRFNDRPLPGPERPPERIIPERIPERPIHERPIPKDIPQMPEQKQIFPNESLWENPQTNEQLLALNFIKKAKIKLKMTGTYKQFIDLLTNFQKTQDGYVMAKMHKILSEHPDLLDEFLTFVPKKEDSVITEIKKVLEEKGVYEEFLKALNLFNQKLMNGKDLVFLLRAYIKEEKMIDSFKKHLGEENPDLYTQEKNENNKRESEKRRNLLHSLGSYRICSHKLPKGNQDPISQEVLNNVCYSFPLYASEGGEDVQTRKSAYMDTLYRLEDERYELELLIQRAETLAESFEIFINRNTDSKEEDSEDEDELDLSSLEMPAPLVNEIIVGIYGDEGEEIFDELITRPKISMPVILKRIYKLMKSWKLELREKEKVWRETNERAFYKALDYHLDFKSADKRYLNFKNFIKYLDCDFDLSDIIDSKDDAIRLIRARYEDEDIEDLMVPGKRTVPVDMAARIRSFYLLIERIWEIKEHPKFNEIMEVTEQQIRVPSADFEERIRVLSKSQAYKLSTVERLIDKICKKENSNGEMFEVTIENNHLLIKGVNIQSKQEKPIDEVIDYSIINDWPFLKRRTTPDRQFRFSFKIVPQLRNNNQKIKYSEDEIDYIFRKNFTRNVKEEL